MGCSVSLWSQMQRRTPRSVDPGIVYSSRGLQRDQATGDFTSVSMETAVLTANFPGSLPDEVVGSTSLPRSICFHSTHGSTEIWERERHRGELKEGGGCEGDRKILPEWNCKSQEDWRKGQRMREREWWEMRMQREENGGRERLTDREDEEEEWLKAMFLKCHPSAQLQSSQCSANGVFEERRRSAEGRSGTVDLVN